MADKNSTGKIQLLRPLLFKHQLINNGEDRLLNDDKINEFFIHSFKDDSVDLKLPLPPHKKTVNDFVFIRKGEMERTFSLEKFHLKRGDFLLIPKNSITTTTYVSADLEGYYCHFSDEFLAGNSHLKRWYTQAASQNFLHLSADQIEILETLLARISFLYKNRDHQPLQYSLIQYYLSTFIAEISLLKKDKISSETSHHPILADFRKILHQNYRTKKSVKDFADLLHISPNHLNKILKTETGKSASTIINETYMLEAKAMLTQTSLDVSEIADELGFEDRSYFSRFFKKHAQISPVDYRKMIDLS